MFRWCSRQFVGILFILLLTSQAWANPIVIDPLEIGLHALGYLFFDAFVDFVVLALAFTILGEVIWLNFTDFSRYFAAVVIGGLAIDLVALVVAHEQIAWTLLMVLLAGYNMYLCRYFFKLTFAKAACIGLAIGIFTNPILWAFTRSF